MQEKSIDEIVQQMTEEHGRTLYLRLPDRIGDESQVKNLLVGDEFRIKIPRQWSKWCHIIFKNQDDQKKNLKILKALKKTGQVKLVNVPREQNFIKIKEKLEKNLRLKKEKKKKGKIILPEPEAEPSYGKYLFVSNLPIQVKVNDVLEAFPKSKNAIILKGTVDNKKQAKVKLISSNLVSKYVNKKISWPTIQGEKIKIKASISLKINKFKKKDKCKKNGENSTDDLNEEVLKSQPNESMNTNSKERVKSIKILNTSEVDDLDPGFGKEEDEDDDDNSENIYSEDNSDEKNED